MSLVSNTSGFSQYASTDTVRNAIQAELNTMPWDGSGPIDSLAKTTDYFIKTYGSGTGVSAQEIAGMIADAYHYNGIPEAGYTPTQTDSTDYGTGTGTSTGGTSYGSTVYNGKVYNLDDPTQRDAYLTVRNADYLKAMNDANAEIDRTADQEIDATTLQYQDKTNEFNKFLDQFKNNTDEYAKSLGDLYEGYGQGNVRRQNYFTRLAPDTYQSGQGSSFKYATDKYNQGKTETTNARNEWKSGLDTGLTRLGNDFTTWLDNYRRSIASQKQANIDLYNSNRDAIEEKSIGWGRSAAKAGFNAVGAVTPESVDMSAYTPYLNFQGLQGSAGANMFKKFTNSIQGVSPLAETLGYQLPTKEKDPLTQYLY